MCTVTEVEAACLSRLYQFDPQSAKRSIAEPAGGTCRWLLENSALLKWRNSTISSLLWLSGSPGCGKSVLCSFLIDELDSLRRRSTVCFFFCRDLVDRGSASDLLRSVLWQLLSAKSHLIRHAITAFAGRDVAKVVEEPDVLWEICTACFEDPSAGDITWILDGLDACEAPGREQLLRLIVSYFSTNKGKSNQRVRVLLTSRLDVQILDTLGRATPRINLDNEHTHTHQDVELLVRKRVSLLQASGRCSQASAEALQESLFCKASRTFLWVSHVLDAFDKSLESSHEVFEDILHGLPDRLTAVYRQIVNRIPTVEREKSRRMLQLVAFSLRPLTLEELNLAWTIRYSDISESDVIGRLDRNIQRTVAGLCDSLVRVVETRVLLVHPTARDFLMYECEKPIDAGNQGYPWYGLEPARAHLAIAQSCVAYLLLEEFKGSLPGDDSIIKELPGEHVGDLGRLTLRDDFEPPGRELEDPADDPSFDYPAMREDRFMGKHGLFIYASKFWSGHLAKAKTLPRSEWANSLNMARQLYNPG